MNDMISIEVLSYTYESFILLILFTSKHESRQCRRKTMERKK